MAASCLWSATPSCTTPFGRRVVGIRATYPRLSGVCSAYETKLHRTTRSLGADGNSLSSRPRISILRWTAGSARNVSDASPASRSVRLLRPRTPRTLRTEPPRAAPRSRSGTRISPVSCILVGYACVPPRIGPGPQISPGFRILDEGAAGGQRRGARQVGERRLGRRTRTRHRLCPLPEPSSRPAPPAHAHVYRLAGFLTATWSECACSVFGTTKKEPPSVTPKLFCFT